MIVNDKEVATYRSHPLAVTDGRVYQGQDSMSLIHNFTLLMQYVLYNYVLV